MNRIDHIPSQSGQKVDKFFVWNGCDDELKKRIEKSNFVKNIRHQLAQKSLFTKSRLLQKRNFKFINI